MRRRARIREKNDLWGAGRLMRLEVTRELSLSQASRWGRERPDSKEPPFVLVDGRDDGG